jgi:hypothetical protein
MEERTNYATSFKVEKYPYTEFTCLFCMKTWYVQKILGTVMYGESCLIGVVLVMELLKRCLKDLH